MNYFAYLILYTVLFHFPLDGFSTPLSDVLNDAGDPPAVTPLHARGFSLLPAPQIVELGNDNVIIDGSWSVDTDLPNDDITVVRLVQGASDLHHLFFSEGGNKMIQLSVKAGIINESEDPALNDQGYLLRINPESIEITGNSKTGLFYGVQSLLQLLRRNSAGQLILPEGEIRDWPDMQLRMVHWDSKHHQKRMETMKRLIDWHAFFKINAIAFEMEDKYEYPSHPIIGAPGAYTKEEMQELTRYALERHIQIVPDIQSPAHMTYVLKHERFAHLRSDNSNYQICMCDPESMDLLFDLYQDMIDATPGVDYFLVSTDEVYYAGICEKCKDEYNDENRSRLWTEFVNKTRDWLAKRGRRQISWIEYPVLPGHISLLPSDVIDGVFSESFVEEESKKGIRQMAYNSMQGAELLFPNYFPTEYRGRQIPGRLYDIRNNTRQYITAGADFIGNFTAGWDDSGLHEETFQLGWASGAQYGWNPDGVTEHQNTADFMDVFYGHDSPDMISIYRELMEEARLYQRGWDQVVSTEREKGYGNSYGKGIGAERTDRVLKLPEIPAEKSLNLSDQFHANYKTLIEEVKARNKDNNQLLYNLNQNLGKVSRNRYSLEVFLSLAYLERYFIKTVWTLDEAEKLMMQASAAADEEKPGNAVRYLTEASNRIDELEDWGRWMWQNLKSTWEKSRFEKNRSVGGRDFLHVMDDVKDHFADRRKGLDYMIAPFQRLDLPGWRKQLNERIHQYANEHDVPVRGLEEVRLED